MKLINTLLEISQNEPIAITLFVMSLFGLMFWLFPKAIRKQSSGSKESEE